MADQPDPRDLAAALSPDTVRALQIVGMMAPNGIPWRKMRKSTNVDDRRNENMTEDQADLKSFQDRFGR